MSGFGLGPFGAGPFGGATHWQYSAAMEELYLRLPDYIRRADKPTLTLKRYLSTIVDQYGEVMALADRIDFVPPSQGGAFGDTSDLTNPETAEYHWLPWLAQLVGVDLDTTLSEQAQRDAVLFASSGWRAGSKTAVANAAKSALTGSRYVAVYDHSTDAGVGTGGEWDVLLITAVSETPDIDAVLAAVIAKRAKPAGVLLWHLAYQADWDQIEALRTTWDGVEAAMSWTALEETGLP